MPLDETFRRAGRLLLQLGEICSTARVYSHASNANNLPLIVANKVTC